MFLFYICTLFSGARGCFLAFSTAGQGPACTPRRKFWSRDGSVAHALGVQSREIWQVNTGLLAAELEPSKTMENQHVICFDPLTAVKDSNTVTAIASSFPRTYSYETLLRVRGPLLCVCGPLQCVRGHDICVYALCMCSVCVCVGG